MSESEVFRRLDLKSRDGQFLWELQDGFVLSPRESTMILETARLYYSGGAPLIRSSH